MTELPSGTVTLVFTDIEGSTRLLQDLGETYERLLIDHRQLLRSQFEAHDGVVVDTQGDAFFVAFPRARDAVAAAVDAQRALAVHEWPGSSAPRVRMGMHTGEPEHVGEGFVGLDVHRAARICAAGHGGQILLSSATRDLVQGHLPSGVGALDLGEHRLRGLDRPEGVAQLVVEGVPPVLTPLKSLDAQPEQATPFAGREADLAESARAALAPTPHEDPPRHVLWSHPRARTSDWRSRVRLPRRGRLADRIQFLGLNIYNTARMASREEVQVELHNLGKIFVQAARDAQSVADLLRRADKRTLERRLARYRESTLWDTQVGAADLAVKQLAALTTLADANRDFERQMRILEPKLRSIRARVFDARYDPAKLDELASETPVIRATVEALSVKLYTAYLRAAEALPRTPGS
jgi:class 3 adenylate cyclase